MLMLSAELGNKSSPPHIRNVAGLALKNAPTAKVHISYPPNLTLDIASLTPLSSGKRPKRRDHTHGHTIKDQARFSPRSRIDSTQVGTVAAQLVAAIATIFLLELGSAGCSAYVVQHPWETYRCRPTHCIAEPDLYQFMQYGVNSYDPPSTRMVCSFELEPVSPLLTKRAVLFRKLETYCMSSSKNARNKIESRTFTGNFTRVYLDIFDISHGLRSGKGSRWVGYAVRAPIVCFWALTKVILLLLTGYINFFTESGFSWYSSRFAGPCPDAHSLGSNVRLMTAILSLHVTAFLFALPANAVGNRCSLLHHVLSAGWPIECFHPQRILIPRQVQLFSKGVIMVRPTVHEVTIVLSSQQRRNLHMTRLSNLGREHSRPNPDVPFRILVIEDILHYTVNAS